MNKTTYKLIPYGKWWEYLLRLKFGMMYWAIFGKKISAKRSPLILPQLGMTIYIPEREDPNATTRIED